MNAQHKPRMSQQKWWRVTRRYTVQEDLLVQAESASEAKMLVRDGVFEDAFGPPEAVGRSTYRKATLLREGKPKEFWTRADYDIFGPPEAVGPDD